MYTVDQLMSLLGISEATLYARLREFDEFLKDHRRKGDNNQNLMTEDGRKILERIEQLRKERLPFEAIKEKLFKELNEGKQVLVGQATAGSLSSLETPENSILALQLENMQLKQRVNDMEERIQDLKERISSLERDKEKLHDLIYNRLPPSQEEIIQKLQARVPRWERFKQLLKGE